MERGIGRWEWGVFVVLVGWACTLSAEDLHLSYYHRLPADALEKGSSRDAATIEDSLLAWQGDQFTVDLSTIEGWDGAEVSLTPVDLAQPGKLPRSDKKKGTLGKKPFKLSLDKEEFADIPARQRAAVLLVVIN